MRRIALFALALAVLAAVPLAVGGGRSFPDRINLPGGFAPEGIDVDHKGTFYVGSIPTGAIYSGSIRTGRGSILVPARAGAQAIGVDESHGRLFVAGGPTGRAFVYDARNGRTLATYQLTTLPTFVNDVVVARGGAYFTDSLNQVLYRIPIDRHGRLGSRSETIPLRGDIAYIAGFNANGIDAARHGRRLVIVQSNTGFLFKVNPWSGLARRIDLGGALLTNGDGVLVDGRTIYVVRNQLNRVAVVEVSRRFRSGRVVTELTDPGFSVPTTIADFGHKLYAVNARFGTPVTPTTPYWITKLRKP